MELHVSSASTFRLSGEFIADMSASAQRSCSEVELLRPGACGVVGPGPSLISVELATPELVSIRDSSRLGSDVVIVEDKGVSGGGREPPLSLVSKINKL